MEILLIILAVFQAGTLVVLIAIFKQRAIDQTLTKVYKNTDTLAQTLSDHRKSIENLPDKIQSAIAEEVKSGLQPLVQSFNQLKNDTSQTYREMATQLVDTHGAFVDMLSHVPHFDTMPGWLQQVEKSIQPLRQVSEIMIILQDQNKTIFKDANSLIVDYKEQGDQVYNSYALLNEKMDEWLVEERKSRHNFAESVTDHLKQFNSLNQKINNMLGEIGSFTSTTENLFEELDKNIPKAVQALAQVGLGHREIEDKLNKTLEGIQTFSQRIASETQQTVQLQNALQENMNKFLTSFEKKLDRGPWWKRLFS